MIGKRDDVDRAGPVLRTEAAEPAPRDRDPMGLLPLAFIAGVAAIRVGWGLVRHEGPTPTVIGLSLLLLLVGGLAAAEVAWHLGHVR
jgi:hypothetical protein